MRIDQTGKILSQAIPDYHDRYINSDPSAKSFKDILMDTMYEAEDAIGNQSYLRDELLSGDVNNLHEVPIAMTESELTLNLAIQVRNKVVEAYQEVMRMQV